MRESVDRRKSKKHRIRNRVIRTIVGIPLALVLAFCLLIGYLSLTEFKPKSKETIAVQTTDRKELGSNQRKSVDAVPDEKKTRAESQIPTGKMLSFLSWNVGYGALGDNADFFMDGGKGVKTASRERVTQNLNEMIEEVKRINPDFAMFQEVDTNSHRSYGIDESKVLSQAMPKGEMTFAYNFKVAFIPYPLPPIGKVNGGIETLSKYQIKEADRISLPNPFSWPNRLGNLKRCLAVHRIQVSNGKELVLVNLHLEAYDDGEGKLAQTKLLREFLQKEVDAGNYVIAGGDFNQIFSNVDASAYPIFDGRWKPGVINVSDFEKDMQLLMDEKTASCRSLDRPLEGADRKDFQFYIIDGFICSKNVTVESTQVQDLAFHASDHNPVVLRASLN